MKSIIRSKWVLGTIALSLIAAVVVPVATAGGKGAAKMTLTDREDDATVGFAVANTTADGRLIIEIHLDDGEADTLFDVWIKIDGVNLTWPDDPSGNLTTNCKGKGNAHVVVDLATEAETIEVTVVVKKPADKYKMAGYEGAAKVAVK